MASTIPTSLSRRTMADLLDALGGISPQRVRLHPQPGTAVKADAIEVERAENRLCELVDGVLVEKAKGYRESILALALSEFLRAFVVPRNLGLVSGADGMFQLFPGLVRIPDVAFTYWSKFPGGRVPDEAAPNLVPDLAVEILSAGNTSQEMVRKRREYFEAGVQEVWIIQLKPRLATVYPPDQGRELNETQALMGGAALPGFTLELRDLFAELDRRAGA